MGVFSSWVALAASVLFVYRLPGHAERGGDHLPSVPRVSRSADEGGLFAVECGIRGGKSFSLLGDTAESGQHVVTILAAQSVGLLRHTSTVVDNSVGVNVG